jgi:hypothetical protein
MIGMGRLRVKAGALMESKDSEAGRVKVPEGLGWSTPRLVVGTAELISVGIEAEYAGPYASEGRAEGLPVLVGTRELISVGIETENGGSKADEGSAVASSLVHGVLLGGGGGGVVVVVVHGVLVPGAMLVFKGVLVVLRGVVVVLGGVIVAPDLTTSKLGSRESAGSAGAANTELARRERTNVVRMTATKE